MQGAWGAYEARFHLIESSRHCRLQKTAFTGTRGLDTGLILTREVDVLQIDSTVKQILHEINQIDDKEYVRDYKGRVPHKEHIRIIFLAAIIESRRL